MKRVTQVKLRESSPVLPIDAAAPVLPPRAEPIPVEPTEIRLAFGERLRLAYNIMTADISLQEDVALVNDTTTLLPGYGVTMNDPKTTITALITGLAGLLAYFNVVISQEWITPIIFVGTMILGWFAGDKKKNDE